MALSGSGGSASGGTRSGSVAMRSVSRFVHFASSSRRRRGAHQARVVDADVGALGDVARGRDVAREVPDDLVRVGEAVGQEAAAVRLREDARVAPAHAGQRPLVLLVARVDLEDVDDEEVARLGALDAERAAEHVHAGERRVAHVVGRVVVLDRAVEPLAAVGAEHVARLDAHLRRDVWMPPVVPDVLLVGELLRVVQREQVLGHAGSFSRWTDGYEVVARDGVAPDAGRVLAATSAQVLLGRRDVRDLDRGRASSRRPSAGRRRASRRRTAASGRGGPRG